jgi:hypothetical protein
MKKIGSGWKWFDIVSIGRDCGGTVAAMLNLRDIKPSFITRNNELSGYITSDVEPSSFIINNVEPYRYIRRNVEPLGYKTSGSVSSSFIPAMLNLLILLPAIWNLQLIATTSDIEPSAYTFFLGARTQIGPRPSTVQASRSHTIRHT